MYHVTHESFHENLIMGGQCTFTIHRWQFSMHDRQQDRQTYSTTAITSSISVDRLLTQSKEGWFYHGSIFTGESGCCPNWFSQVWKNHYLISMCWNQIHWSLKKERKKETL